MATSLYRSLCGRGFAIVPLSNAQKATLQSGVMKWRDEHKFRFPPTDVIDPPKPDEWRQEYRACFDTLMSIAVPSFSILLNELRQNGHSVAAERVLRALHSSRSRGERHSQIKLANSDLPVQNLSKEMFTTSFFNIFNYRWGFLGPHKDRCLLTVIYTLNDRSCSKRLWVRARLDHLDEAQRQHGTEAQPSWTDLDQFTDAGSAVIFVGEEMEQLTGGVFRAVEHSVGDKAGAREDSDSSAQDLPNRLSAALVLSAELSDPT